MIELILIGAAALLLARRQKQLTGIGRIKRRIYKEVSDVQNLGVDFSKKYSELDRYDLQYLQQIGEKYGYKQTKRSFEAGKPYTESYFNSLKRAWNAVSGLQGIGKTRDYNDYRVYNSDGKTVLIYREYLQPAVEHIEQEQPEPPAAETAEVTVVTEPEPTPEVTPESELTKQQQLLMVAPHMKVYDEQTGTFLQGDQRPDNFNYVVWQKLVTKNGEVMQYPIAAYEYEAPAAAFVERRKAAFKREKESSWNNPYKSWDYSSVSIRVLPIDKVNMQSISGLPY